MASRAPIPEELDPPAASTPPDPDQLLTRRQAAGLLQVSERYLELLAVHGGGPPYLKLGRCVRFRRSTLRAWLAGREQRSSSEPPAGDLDDDQGLEVEPRQRQAGGGDR